MLVRDRFHCQLDGEFLHKVQCALRNLDFRRAESFFDKVLSVGSHPETWSLYGQCLMFQGKHAAAVSAYEQAWEAAKSCGSAELRWRACFGLSRAYGELGNSFAEKQFHQLGRAAVMDAFFAGMLSEIPEELQLWNAVEKLRSGLSKETAAELEDLVEHFRDLDLRGRAAIMLARFQRGQSQQLTLQIACQSFCQAGDLFELMRATEKLAENLLSQRDWEEGRKRLLMAKKIASQLQLRTKVAMHQKLAARLFRSLTILQETASLN